MERSCRVAVIIEYIIEHRGASCISQCTVGTAVCCVVFTSHSHSDYRYFPRVQYHAISFSKFWDLPPVVPAPFTDQLYPLSYNIQYLGMVLFDSAMLLIIIIYLRDRELSSCLEKSISNEIFLVRGLYVKMKKGAIMSPSRQTSSKTASKKKKSSSSASIFSFKKVARCPKCKNTGKTAE